MEENVIIFIVYFCLLLFDKYYTNSCTIVIYFWKVIFNIFPTLIWIYLFIERYHIECHHCRLCGTCICRVGIQVGPIKKIYRFTEWTSFSQIKDLHFQAPLDPFTAYKPVIHLKFWYKFQSIIITKNCWYF